MTTDRIKGFRPSAVILDEPAAVSPCGPAPDACGDELCERHEREQAHADGEPTAEDRHAGFDLAGDPTTHRGPREKCHDPACEYAQCEDGFVPDAPRAPGLCANCGDSKAWHRPA